MGHDISAYANYLTEEETEVAYLRKNMTNPFKNEIYKALDCEACNAGVSGNGSVRVFLKQDLLSALKYLGDNPDLEPERKFIHDCLANLDELESIIVGFY
jgi:hypothetical protein